MFPDIVIRLALAMQEQGGRLFVVGGSVRDMLLHIEPKDFDLEVHGVETMRLEEIVRSFNPEWMDTVGRSYGVLKVRIGGVDLDIAPPRRDSKVGEGHKGILAVPDPTLTPVEAARRRDFTVGAMMLDPLTGELFDFFGGQEDLQQGILWATDPRSFPDDSLRVLRAVQFAARFGFVVEAGTLELCRRVAATKDFAKQSPARVTGEWRKLLLQSPRPSVGLQLGLETGAWHALHPELARLTSVQQDHFWHPEGPVFEHIKMAVDRAAVIVRREGLAEDDALVLLLATLLHDGGKFETTYEEGGHWHSPGHAAAGVAVAQEFFARNAFGQGIETRVLPLIADHMFLTDKGLETSDKAIRRHADALRPATFELLVWLWEADIMGRAFSDREFAEGRIMIQRAEALYVSKGEKIPSLLTGKELIRELGMKESRELGDVLRAIYEAQLDGRVVTHEEALAMARDVYEGRRFR